MHLSYTNTIVAFAQFKKDIQFLKMRRNRKSSDYKIAGCLAFRINKHFVLHTDNKKSKDIAANANACLALGLALKYILGTKNLNDIKLDLNEIVYLLSDRHVNQETLALAFSQMN